jgi:nitrate/nitrite-specific signal transduction histidine kinase
MNGFIKVSSLSIFILCFLLPVESQAGINNISSAINKAGRQRMLTQRIVATYCQAGMDIKRNKSKQQLEDAITLFEQQLKELKTFRPTGRINKQLNNVSQLWQSMRQVASGPILRTKAAELRDIAEETLRASHRVVIMLQDESDSQAGHLVNISGRQRMLSQRMSNLYMLQSWNFTSSEYTGDYSGAINEFKGALLELMKSPLNTSRINKKLDQARKQFAMLERSLHQKNDEYIPLLVKMSADKLLIIMNDITKMYEQVASSS